MKVLHVSTFDCDGGAARAATRIHSSLLNLSHPEICSRIRVARKNTDLASTYESRLKLAKFWRRIKDAVASRLLSLQSSPNPIYHSLSCMPCGLDRELNSSNANLINLHWVQGEMLSIEAIGRLRKPIVWTLHDSWAFCGSEHHPHGLGDLRYQHGYLASNRLPGHRGVDLDRWCWLRKKQAWRHPMQIVCPSQWMASCVMKSSLMYDWPVQIIPNPLPTTLYKPWPRLLARQLFGLPSNEPLILFGAIRAIDDSNKGWDLLLPALQRLAHSYPTLRAVVFGQSKPVDSISIDIPVHYVGRLHDDQSLAMLYSAVDVMVVPSRMEAFGQTASEAQSCGVPVVAFDCTGLSDVVQNHQTGYLAAPYSSESLACGISWILEDQARRHQLGANARRRAEQLWSEEIIARAYINLYESILELNKDK